MPTDTTKAPTSSTIGPMIDHVVVPLIELPVMMSRPWRVHSRPSSTRTTPATTHNGLAMGQLNHAPGHPRAGSALGDVHQHLADRTALHRVLGVGEPLERVVVQGH